MEFIHFATFLVALISSILSGIAGGGGSFVMAPYWLLAGLSPVQGATTGAFMAIGMGGSSLLAFRGSGHMPHNKHLIILLIILTFLMSAIGPFFLPHISIDVFQPVIAILTLLSLPILFINHTMIELNNRRKIVGLIFLGVILLVSSFITSSAFSIIIAIILSQMFDFTVLQITAIRRLIGLIQSSVIFFILLSLGGFVWQHALLALLGGTIGSYVGTRFAIKRGERFAKYSIAVAAIVSSIALLI